MRMAGSSHASERSSMHTSVTRVIVLSLAALTTTACASKSTSGVPSVYLVLPQASSERMLPTQFLERDAVLEAGSVQGIVVRDAQLCVFVNISGQTFEIAVAGGAVTDNNSTSALITAANASRYRWVLRRSAPVTSTCGKLQAEVIYDTGLRRENLGQQISRTK